MELGAGLVEQGVADGPGDEIFTHELVETLHRFNLIIFGSNIWIPTFYEQNIMKNHSHISY